MRIPIVVNMENPQPIYHQIKEQLRDLILGGHLPSGTLLPSIRGLSEQLGVSVITTRRVYQDLENEGFIRTRQGLGTFVAEAPERAREAHRSALIRNALSEAIETGMRMDFSPEELEELFTELLREKFGPKERQP